MLHKVLLVQWVHIGSHEIVHYACWQLGQLLNEAVIGVTM